VCCEVVRRRSGKLCRELLVYVLEEWGGDDGEGEGQGEE